MKLQDKEHTHLAMTFPTMRHRRFTSNGDDAGRRVSGRTFGAARDEVTEVVNRAALGISLGLKVPGKEVDDCASVKIQVSRTYGVCMHQFSPVTCNG